VAAALEPPGQIATLILPADTAWNDADGPAAALPRRAPAKVSEDAVARAATALKSGKKTALLIRGAALKERGLNAAGRIAAKSGARILCDTFTSRIQRGAGRVKIDRIPYFAEQIVETMQDVQELIIVGSKPPVSFFAYPGKPSWCTPETALIHYLSFPHEDGVGALEALADALGAPKEPANVAELKRADLPSGQMNQFTVGQVIAHFLPEGAIISDEGATCGVGTTVATVTAPPHDHLSLTGGSIGQGLPLATGAAIAAPGRKVVCIHGDGGAMYTLQALWTQAREKLDVTTVIFANRSYAILNIELGRVGAQNPGPKALSMLDLHNPELDWVHLAKGMGVEATRAETIEEFTAQFADAIKQKGPRLVEVVL
jgi:acetolactate synthase-1/2/3 large subunit